MGILCMHALKFLNCNSILHLSSCYILNTVDKISEGWGQNQIGHQQADDPNLLSVGSIDLWHKLHMNCIMDPSSKQADDMNLVHRMQHNTTGAATFCFDGF